MPERVFLLDYALLPDGRFFNVADNSRVTLGGHERRRYEVEVQQVCEGSVMKREGRLKEWGLQLKLWEGQTFHPFERSGRLHWLRAEAKCDAPAAIFRIEKGPARDPINSSLSSTWYESYRSAVEKGRISESLPR